jgi:preprotein translocase subunit YajC
MSLLDFLISPAQAQAVGAAPAGNPLTGLLLPLGFLAVMFFVMIWPQMKRQKAHRELLSKLAKGDEVITNGGIVGRVDDVRDSFVTIEIADNVQVKLQKGAISAVLPKGTLKSI